MAMPIWRKAIWIICIPRKGRSWLRIYYFRPRDAKVAAKYSAQFSKIQTFTIDKVFGGWEKAQKTHFVNGAIYDQIYNEKR